MKKSFLFMILFFSSLLYSQNGYIVDGNDTIKANIEISNFKVSANVKQEKLQKKSMFLLTDKRKPINLEN